MSALDTWACCQTRATDIQRTADACKRVSGPHCGSDTTAAQTSAPLIRGVAPNSPSRVRVAADGDLKLAAGSKAATKYH